MPARCVHTFNKFLGLLQRRSLIDLNENSFELTKQVKNKVNVFDGWNQCSCVLVFSFSVIFFLDFSVVSCAYAKRKCTSHKAIG